jgi:hypothetical protein
MIRINGGPARSGIKFTPGRLQERKSDWTCPRCGHENKGYWTNCFGPGCNERRAS